MADILNPASETKSNYCYLMISLDDVNKPGYLTSSASLEKLVASVQAQNTLVDIQFPDKRGILFDWANKVTYSYQPVSRDEQCSLALALRRYTEP